MKRIIRLTESELHRIVKNTVKRVLREQREPWDHHDPDYEDDWFENLPDMEKDDDLMLHRKRKHGDKTQSQ